ncbi:MAG: HAMP domain-containing sensor histidine kinase [Candidatus Zixiibacteriota bacterium]
MTYSTGKFILIALFTVLLIVLVNLVWWVNYQRTEQMLEDQLGRRLAAVASGASISFPPEQVDSLCYGSLDAYFRALSVMEQVRQSDSLSEVFILDEDYYYLATTSLESDSTYFLSEIHAGRIDSVLFGLTAGVCLTPTYRSGDLYLKSAFAPLLRGDNVVVAVVGVEASVDYFDSLTELRHNLYYASGFSLLAGLVLGLIFLWWQRRINAAEQKLFLGETHAHLGRMVAVVAHELRNPLMIIRASAERLQKKTAQSEAGFVMEEVDRLNEIVTGYLEFARAGGSLLKSEQPSEINLHELVVGVRKHLAEKYAGQEITWLGQDVPAELSMVSYARSLRQVLLNLLFNGVESCLAAGRRVAVGLTANEDGTFVQMSVIDRGGGLSRKEQRRVFTPFYTTKQSGSGLGLYLSRTIVIEMGGEIKLKSQPGQGTEIMIRLPKAARK